MTFLSMCCFIHMEKFGEASFFMIGSLSWACFDARKAK